MPRQHASDTLWEVSLPSPVDTIEVLVPMVPDDGTVQRRARSDAFLRVRMLWMPATASKLGSTAGL